MARLEWGQKRTCSGCGTRFYDMLKLPVICPKCHGAVEIDAPFKVRRASGAAAVAKATPARQPAAVIAIEADELEVEEEAVVDDLDGGDADDSGLMEDASDLGEDDEDMAEVMEHLDEDIKDDV